MGRRSEPAAPRRSPRARLHARTRAPCGVAPASLARRAQAPPLTRGRGRADPAAPPHHGAGGARGEGSTASVALSPVLEDGSPSPTAAPRALPVPEQSQQPQYPDPALDTHRRSFILSSRCVAAGLAQRLSLLEVLEAPAAYRSPCAQQQLRLQWGPHGGLCRHVPVHRGPRDPTTWL